MRSLHLLAPALSLFSFASHVLADFPAFQNDTDYAKKKWGNYTRQHFISEPAFWGPPVPNVVVSPQPGVSPSKHVMVTPYGYRLPRSNPMLLNAEDMSVVWYGPRLSWDTLGAAVQECNNTQYITLWSGFGADGWKKGNHFLLDENYDVKYNISAQGDFTYADAHELYITPQCTAIFPVYRNSPRNVTLDNVSTEYVLDSFFQEVDIATNSLIFQWNATEHVPIEDTYWNSTILGEGHASNAGFDWFHINSIQKDHRGNYLVSSRHMHTIYYVSGHNGHVIWQLGGKKNMFRDLSDGYATDFSWQHHARWTDDTLTTLSLFDNRNTGFHRDPRQSSARGAIIHLDTYNHTATLAHEYLSPILARPYREGSMQLLHDGPSASGPNALVGWGMYPSFTEFTPDGRVVWDVAFSPPGLNRWSPDNYRSQKLNFTGRPRTSPKIAPGPRKEYAFNEVSSAFHIPLRDKSGAARGNDTVYFSWNGATEVEGWVVLASNSTGEELGMEDFWARTDREGFETSVFVGRGTRRVMVLAVGEGEVVLGRSRTVDMVDFSVYGPEDLPDQEELARWTRECRAWGRRSGGVLGRFHAKWDDVKGGLKEASPPVAAAAGAGVGVAGTLAVLLVVLLVLRKKGGNDRRGGFVRAATAEEREEAFYIGDDDEDDDESADGRYYDDRVVYGKKEVDSEESTLRSCSSSSDPMKEVD
ncbi:ASST-domain-containing protein [Elsinoe ampelina]|uniref:ASST-domain-containing protein n=1 Tax=Elsinoe ampelina TaxID=302913 RepID=A0A6A6G8S6_9PEZI|nr:ASST-domain-containing protein [Elsinoe ampelina]